MVEDSFASNAGCALEEQSISFIVRKFHRMINFSVVLINFKYETAVIVSQRKQVHDDIIHAIKIVGV